MALLNPFGSKGGALPDRMLGSKYDVVKAVYDNLSMLEAFMEDPHLAFLEENINQIKQVLAMTPQISTVVENEYAIANAGSNAKKAESASQTAKEWASKEEGTVDGEEYSAKFYAKQASNHKDTAENLVNSIEDLREPVQNINSNINKVIQVNNNIDNINKVVEDLNGEYNAPLPDLGIVGENNVTLPSGSLINNISFYIKDILKVSSNILEIIKVSSRLENLPSQEEAIKTLELIEKIIEKANNLDSKITAYFDKLSKYQTDINNLVNSSKADITSITSSSIDEIKKNYNDVSVLVNEVKDLADKCNYLHDQCVLILLEIRNIYYTYKTDLELEKQEIIEEFIKYVNEVLLKELDKTIDSAVNEALKDLNVIINDLKNQLNIYVESLKSSLKNDLINTSDIEKEKITKHAELKIQELNKLNIEITSMLNSLYESKLTSFNQNANNSLNKLNEAGKAQVDNIIREADNKLNEINQINENVLNAVENVTNLVNRVRPVDWNAESGDNAILNKPDIYTKDEINVKLSTVYKYRGSVDTFQDLPKSNLEIGYVYNVLEDGMNYAWDGGKWDSLGSLINLRDYLKFERSEDGLNRLANLNNYDIITIIDSKNIPHDLIKINAKDIIKLGNINLSMDLQSKSGIITINDEYIIATLKDLEKLKTELNDTLKIVVSESKPAEESILQNKLYGFNSSTNSVFNPNSEISNIIIAENQNTIDPEKISNGTAIVIKQQNLL